MRQLDSIRYANFLAKGLEKNAIFDLNDSNNRDNCYQPYHLMREMFKRHAIEINTADMNNGKPVAFCVHLNAQKQRGTEAVYLLMLETRQAYPANEISPGRNDYRKIFTWDDRLAGSGRYIKINFPNVLHVHPADGFLSRDRFCCLIAGNKALAQPDELDLYSERVKAIRWFEQNALADFDLYGVDWDIAAAGSGVTGKATHRFWRMLSHVIKLRPFPSYRGRIASKRDVLTRTRFAICYENVRDLPGYITEKIFDCFFSGCVPVYWGASNITDHIPADCFIDRRNFGDTAEVYTFLKAMTENDFRGYQQCIAAFLQSKAAYPFSSEFFAETIVSTIVQDIGRQA